MALEDIKPSTLRVSIGSTLSSVTSEDAEAAHRRALGRGYLDLAAASEKVARAGPRRELVNPFRFADAPPGVLPDGARTLAQDALLSGRMGWAAAQREEHLRLAQDEQVIQFLPSLGFAGYAQAFANGYGYLGYSYLSELAQVPEYRVISETIASELTREWIELKSTTHRDRRRLPREKAAKLEKIEEKLDALKTKDVFREVAESDGFLGRSHLYFDTGDTDDPNELKLPIGSGNDNLSQRKVSLERPLLALRTVEATWCYATRYNATNPLKPDWYKPSAWFVMGTELHASRLRPFVGREVPDLLKAAYNFGGLSLSQMAKPYVDNWLRTRQAVADLVWSFSNNVLFTDLQTLLQGGAEADLVLNRVLAFNALRNNQGTLVLNKASEDWKNVSTPIAGLHELQAQAQEHMAAVSRIPLVKLLGIQPSGLNASSEGEIRTFYDTVAAYQEKYFRDPLTRVINFVQLSLFGEIDPEITFEFKPLWQLDEVAEAGVQQTKSTTRETDIAAGVISSEEGREAVANDPKSQYAGLDLSETEAPGELEEEEDLYGTAPEKDPDGEEAGELSEQRPAMRRRSKPGGGLIDPKPKSSRLGASLTSRAEEFGKPASGGFDAAQVAKSTVGYVKKARNPKEQC